MKKKLLVFIILIISQFVTLYAFAGSDGNLELLQAQAANARVIIGLIFKKQ